MRMIGMLATCLGAIFVCSACGFLDDDIALSDEEFEASFHGVGHGSLSASTHGRSTYRSSCGIGIGIGRSYVSGGHGSHHSHAHHHMDPSILDMPATHITASAGHAAANAAHVAVIERRDPGLPIYTNGEVDTWGDYLQAEMERARR